ncbi:MAG: N-acylneuraminate cytidylyltransferase [Ignavibacteriaceae bacterium]|nr:N-acylneuraminate cytidylyltransferase [Ignavibacteriaceae bacterium]
MKVLGVIPARSGSKGVPGKNIKKLGGIPLIQYTINSALSSKLLTKIVVSTDSEEIAEVCKNAGLTVPFLRPTYLAGDDIKTVDVVKHVLKYYLELGEEYDSVCLLQPTYPFRKHGLIDECIKEFYEKQDDSFVTVLEVPHQFHPAWILQQSEDHLSPVLGWEEFTKRRQKLSPAYYRDGAVYISSVKGIFQFDRLVFGKIGLLLNDRDFYINIDTELDWEYANKLVRVWNNKVE